MRRGSTTITGAGLNRMTGKHDCAMRYEDALYFSINRRHRATNPPPLGTAGFGAAIVCGWKDTFRAPRKIFCGRLVRVLVTGVWWPAEYKPVVLMARIGQDLEDLAEHAWLRAGALELLVKEVQLLGVHRRCPTPAGPGRLVVLAVIRRAEIIDCVDKTQYETFSSPADHDIDGHVVIIGGDFVGVTPRWTLARIPQKAADPGEPTVSHPCDTAMHGFLVESASQVGACGVLFIRMNER